MDTSTQPAIEVDAVARTTHRGPGPFPHTVVLGGRALDVDEPREVGGHESGPDPLELLTGALAACTAMTMRAYAERKGWDLGSTAVEVRYVSVSAGAPQRYAVLIEPDPGLDPEQLRRLVAIAGRCPVRRALGAPAEFAEAVVAPGGRDAA
jgi:putative redox protein